MGEIINGVASEYEITKVSSANILTASGEIRYPTYRGITYEVTGDGVLEVETMYDQNNKSMDVTSKLIMSKEAFVDAYNKYIKKEENKETE